MPYYEYMEDGKIVVRYAKVDARDAFPGRVQVPRRIRVIAARHKDEGAYVNEDMTKGFYKEEQKDPHFNDKMGKALGLKPGQIKDVWAAPDAPDPYAAREGITT